MKYYVVLKGRTPGIYENWDDAREQVQNFPGALYKSYNTPGEAATAYRKLDLATDEKDLRNLLFNTDKRDTKISNTLRTDNSSVANKDKYPPEVDTDAWAVDASCLGNPGTMEYRGVDLKTGKELFRVGPFKNATNNIGEFLAIVHAMALMAKKGETHNIYSDSKTGMSWIRRKAVKTMVKPDEKNKKVFELLARGVAWLRTHTYSGKLMKWETERWGEIPADFGRK